MPVESTLPLLFAPSSLPASTLLDGVHASLGEQVRPWAERGAFASGSQWWAMCSGAAAPDANMALLADADPGTVEAAIATFVSFGVPAMVFLTGAGLAHADALTRRGYALVGTMPLMACALDADGPGVALPPGFSVVPARGAEDAGQVAELLRRSFGLDLEVCAAFANERLAARDDFGLWLLRDRGVPVSTVITTWAPPFVGVWCMGTPTDLQGRGYGRSLLGEVLTRAARDGARVALLGASAAGEPLYRRLGFEVLEHWQAFADAESTQI